MTSPKEILTAHQRLTESECTCGWGQAPAEIGKSHAEHVLFEFEAAGFVIVDEDRLGRMAMRDDW